MHEARPESWLSFRLFVLPEHAIEHGEDGLLLGLWEAGEALSTTEIYTHVSMDRLKAVNTRTHPAHLEHTRAPAPFLLAAEAAKESLCRAGREIWYAQRAR